LNAEVNKNVYTSHFGVLVLSAEQTDSGSKLQACLALGVPVRKHVSPES